MSFFDTMILDVIVILFPIFSVLLLKAYYKNTGKLNKDFLIDLANITSLFLLIKYYNPDMTYDELLVNMPLIISILYNRKYASIAIAIILIGFNALIGNNIIITVIEYLFYIIIFVILLKKIKSPNTVILTITCIKGVFMTIEQYYILENQALTTIIKVAIALIVFYLISTIVINIISKIEETISLNQTLKELEKEGIDAFDIDAGCYETLDYIFPPAYLGESCMSYVCEDARKVVNVPLINAGTHNPESALELIESGNVDFVSFGRALIADPMMPKKLMKNHREDVRPCLRCNAVLDVFGIIIQN